MSEEKVRGAPFTIGSFLWRLLFALIVVLVTYNPTPYSYLQWLWSSKGSHALGPEHAVAGIALVGGWLIVLTATHRALGALGLIVVAAFLGALVWWMIDAGWLAGTSLGVIQWVSLVCLAILLAVGMSWAFIWRRITGQYEVDDVNH